MYRTNPKENEAVKRCIKRGYKPTLGDKVTLSFLFYLRWHVNLLKDKKDFIKQIRKGYKPTFGDKVAPSFLEYIIEHIIGCVSFGSCAPISQKKLAHFQKWLEHNTNTFNKNVVSIIDPTAIRPVKNLKDSGVSYSIDEETVVRLHKGVEDSLEAIKNVKGVALWDDATKATMKDAIKSLGSGADYAQDYAKKQMDIITKKLDEEGVPFDMKYIQTRASFLREEAEEASFAFKSNAYNLIADQLDLIAEKQILGKDLATMAKEYRKNYRRLMQLSQAIDIPRGKIDPYKLAKVIETNEYSWLHYSEDPFKNEITQLLDGLEDPFKDEITQFTRIKGLELAFRASLRYRKMDGLLQDSQDMRRAENRSNFNKRMIDQIEPGVIKLSPMFGRGGSGDFYKLNNQAWETLLGGVKEKLDSIKNVEGVAKWDDATQKTVKKAINKLGDGAEEAIKVANEEITEITKKLDEEGVPFDMEYIQSKASELKEMAEGASFAAKRNAYNLIADQLNQIAEKQILGTKRATQSRAYKKEYKRIEFLQKAWDGRNLDPYKLATVIETNDNNGWLMDNKDPFMNEVKDYLTAIPKDPFHDRIN